MHILKIFKGIMSSFQLDSIILVLYAILTISVVSVNHELARDSAFTFHALDWEYIHKMPQNEMTMVVLVSTPIRVASLCLFACMSIPCLCLSFKGAYIHACIPNSC